MKIRFIRHGDPDYVNDTLTDKGRKEAELLAETVHRLELGECYMSPLGRAKDTAAYSLKAAGKNAEILDWLREFPVRVDVNSSETLQKAYPDAEYKDGKFQPRIPWDIIPGYWTSCPEYSHPFLWRESEVADHSDLVSVYDRVTEELDSFLEKYGYVREGSHYRVVKENEKTVTFFCHFGIICVLLSHLWNISPFILWHSLALAPTSVTEIVTEEREQGIAYFRGLRLGDISHLYAGNVEPSFACRFCETYGNKEQRH